MEVAQFLHEHGARVTDCDRDVTRKGRAIHYACWGGNMRTILWLLSVGASLDDVDVVENTPLLYAIFGGHVAVVALLEAP